MRIPLEAGDRVVSITTVRDMVLVVTEQGCLYRITYDDYGGVQVSRL